MGTLGVLPLSVHTVPTQVIAVCYVIPWGIGIALSIRLGATLSHNVKRAQLLVVTCAVVSTVLFAIMAFFMYTCRNFVFLLFTTDQDVINGCERIWANVVIYFFLASVFGINMGISTGLGMQWTLGVVTVVFLWIVGLPAVYYFALVCGGGLGTAWTMVFPPYIFMNAVLVVSFYRADWHAISEEIRKREGISDSHLVEGDIETQVSHDGTQHASLTVELSKLVSLVEKESEP